MELSDTVELMNSDDYKDRFRAEYYQVKIRHQKLDNILHKYNSGSLEFDLSCSIGILTEQLEIMEDYLNALEDRAFTEGISL